MKHLAVVVFLVSGTLSAQQDEKPERAFAACAGCHGLPDARLEWDDAWIGRIATTACVQPPAPKGEHERLALMTWLRSELVAQPRTEARSRAPREGESSVKAPFARGSVLLVREDDDATAKAGAVRLVWDGDDGARAVPAGRYRVRHYRFVQKDESGIVWQLWASGQGREIVLPAAESVDLGLDLTVDLKPNAARRGQALQVGVAVTSDSGMGATIVRNGDRVPAHYRIELKNAPAITGDLAYG